MAARHLPLAPDSWTRVPGPKPSGSATGLASPQPHGDNGAWRTEQGSQGGTTWRPSGQPAREFTGAALGRHPLPDGLCSKEQTAAIQRGCQGALVSTALASTQPHTQMGTRGHAFLDTGFLPVAHRSSPVSMLEPRSEGATQLILLNSQMHPRWHKYRDTHPALLHVPRPRQPLPQHTLPLPGADGGHRLPHGTMKR